MLRNLILSFVFLGASLCPVLSQATSCANPVQVLEGFAIDANTQKPLKDVSVITFFDDREYAGSPKNGKDVPEGILDYARGRPYPKGRRCPDFKTVTLILSKKNYFTRRVTLKLKKLKQELMLADEGTVNVIHVGNLKMYPVDESFRSFMLSQFGFVPKE